MVDDIELNAAINNIELMYPPDSSYPDTAAIGQKLLLDAIYENWRDLPKSIILTLSDYCEDEDI